MAGSSLLHMVFLVAVSGGTLRSCVRASLQPLLLLQNYGIQGAQAAAAAPRARGIFPNQELNSHVPCPGSGSTYWTTREVPLKTPFTLYPAFNGALLNFPASVLMGLCSSGVRHLDSKHRQNARAFNLKGKGEEG